MKVLSEVEYNSALATFNERLAKWDDAQAAYEAIVEEAELDDLINSAADFREKAVKVRDELIKNWINSQNKENQDNDKHSTRTSNVAPQVNLPRIDLPKFSGDVLKFAPFWQQFKSCVDDLDYPVVTKFNYLLSCLKGEAKTEIEGMPVIEGNYESAKEILEKRYGRKELIVFSHVQELLVISVREQLARFRDVLNVHVRSLAAQGITSDKFGAILMPIIVTKLPEEIRLEWSRDNEGKEDDLDHLLKFLDTEIKRRERCRSFGTLQPNSQAQPQEKQKNRQGSAIALHTNSNGNGAIRKCIFCNGTNHASIKCVRYQDVSVTDRYEMLKNANVCFKCLSPKHHASKCVHKCSYCKGFHHVTICRKVEIIGSDEISGQNVSSNASNSDLSSDEGCDESSDENYGANLLSVNHKTVSLMPLACVNVNGKQATVLFDSGSDKSYISQEFVYRVKPKYVKQTSVSFATFGGRSHGSKTKMYQFSMKGLCGSDEVTVQLPEVPVICLPLGKLKVDSALLEEFDHLDLAFDYKDSSPHVTTDILIGQDLYWSFILGDVFRSESSNLVAQKSVFGWILSGCTRSSNSDGISLLNVGIISEQVAKSFWDLESVGIQGNDESIDPVRDKFNQSIAYSAESGPYKVPLMSRNLPPADQKFRKTGQIRVGSVVLIKEDNMPKMKWSLGVVKKLHMGRDCIPRAADLDTRHGQRTRAIQRLYNLEITDCEKESCSDRDSVENVSAQNKDVGNCPANQNDKVGTESQRPKSLRKLPKKFEDYV